MLLRRCLAQVAGIAVLAALAGCGSSTKNSGNFATVTGTVTNGGAPVADAKVNFWSTSEGGGQRGGSYSATTDSSGKYAILSMGKDAGIPPGMYKVTITKSTVQGNLPADWDAGQAEASGQAKNVLPKEYESLSSTKLSVTLAPGKNEGKDFDLKGKASGSTMKPP